MIQCLTDADVPETTSVLRPEPLIRLASVGQNNDLALFCHLFAQHYGFCTNTNNKTTTSRCIDSAVDVIVVYSRHLRKNRGVSFNATFVINPLLPQPPLDLRVLLASTVLLTATIQTKTRPWRYVRNFTSLICFKRSAEWPVLGFLLLSKHH